MRILSLLGLAMLTPILLAADFPPVDKLPAQAGLPDPLKCLDGTVVSTKEAWESKRRPELKELFQHYMYGYFPPRPDKVDFQIGRVDSKALGGKATLKEITIAFGPPGTPKLQVLLFIPNKRQGPAPA